MSRTERLQIRISPELKEKVEKIAKERNVSVSELLVDYIKRLPSPKVVLAISAFAPIAALSLPTARSFAASNAFEACLRALR